MQAQYLQAAALVLPNPLNNSRITIYYNNNNNEATALAKELAASVLPEGPVSKAWWPVPSSGDKRPSLPNWILKASRILLSLYLVFQTESEVSGSGISIFHYP